jgi:hypothetical protein
MEINSILGASITWPSLLNPAKKINQPPSLRKRAKYRLFPPNNNQKRKQELHRERVLIG